MTSRFTVEPERESLTRATEKGREEGEEPQARALGATETLRAAKCLSEFTTRGEKRQGMEILRRKLEMQTFMKMNDKSKCLLITQTSYSRLGKSLH